MKPSGQPCVAGRKSGIPTLKLCAFAGSFLILATAGHVAGEPRNVRVELKNGKVIEGVIRQIEDSQFLVQTGEELYEITGEEIAAVDGRPGAPADLSSSRRLLRYETYEVVATNGDVELWTKLRLTNESSRVWTYIQWGAKERELSMFRTMRAFDQFGNALAHRIEPRAGSELYNVIVDLVVPVAPGEELALAERLTNPGMARRDDDSGGFVLTFAGDFPEDRIHTRKVRLPRGARVETVEPEPSFQFEHEGSPIIVWRHYYPEGEEFPLTVAYRLAGDDPGVSPQGD